jgi:putative hydrolase
MGAQLVGKMNHPVERFRRFRALDHDGVNVEWHLHTSHTDGVAGVSEILHTAVEKGLRSIAFTEHVRRTSKWFAEFSAGVRAAAARFPSLEVLVGCEAKALDKNGALDASDEILELCDLVLGSVHRIPHVTGESRPFAELTTPELCDRELQLALGLISGGRAGALAHPMGMLQRQRGIFPETAMREILAAASACGMPVEISSSYLVDWDAFLALCCEYDPLVSIGSDAHTLGELGACRDRLRASGVGAG